MTQEKAKELLPIIQAIADGKDFIIQTPNGNGGWVDCNGVLDSELFYYTYRVKPELSEIKPITAEDLKKDKDISHKLRDTVQGMKHYRPFKNCDELIDYWYDFTGVINCSPKLFMPTIWVKHKEYGTDFLITAYDNDNESIGANVIINDIGVTMKMLFDNYTFCDGSVCGVIK